MNYKIHKLKQDELPKNLKTIPSPPKGLFVRGAPLANYDTLPKIAIVGSRKVTPYGQFVTESLSETLSRAGIVIVSGLALGIDSIAHQAALRSGGRTVAVLPGGLDVIYPRSHHHIAMDILEANGSLISEYPKGTPPLRPHFVARNRIVSGFADALLVTEAAARSGTVHTANFALEQGRPVLAVPGNINAAQSEGPNNLIKAGALPVTNERDIFEALGITQQTTQTETMAYTPEEQTIIRLLKEGTTDAHELQQASKLSTPVFNQTLTMLEINGAVKPLGNNHWTLR